MLQFKKLPNETDTEFICRVCSHKDLIGTWDKVADVINDALNLSYTESKYRKQYQALLNEDVFEQEVSNSCLDVDDKIKALEQAKEELKKERIKVQTCNLERNRLDRDVARQELFYENIGKYIQSKERPKFNPSRTPKHKDIKYLLGIADVHMGALWATPTNEYSNKIVQDRFEILFDNVKQFVEEEQLNELSVVLLGDLIDGVLRISNLQAQDTKVSRACADIAEIIGEFIDRLTEECHIHIDLYDAVYGNHSTQRYLGQKNNYDMLEDLGYTIARYIQCYLRKNENVTFYMPKDGEMYVEFELNGFNFIAFHGHTIKDLNNAISKLTMRNHKFYDYSLSGHIHSSCEITEGINGLHNVQDIRFPSICGSDPFADSIFKQSKASAMICGFEKDYGYTETKRFILN